MTVDDLDLAAGLEDLARSAPDNPTRLASVHVRYRRHQRRRRAVCASAVVATMAAGIAGAESFASSGRRMNVAAGGGSNLPACSAPPVDKSSVPGAPPKSPVPAAPPAIGETFSGGGTIVTVGRSTITVDEMGGPLTGKVTLTVTPATKLFRLSPQPNVGDVAATITQLAVGDGAKFIAVHSSATINALVELHAGPAADANPPRAADAPGAKQQGTPDPVTTPPPVGGPFKAAGTVAAYSPGSLTVNVTRGNLTGTVTFAIHCAPALPVVGHTVEIAGTRTAADTYDATVLAAP